MDILLSLGLQLFEKLIPIANGFLLIDLLSIEMLELLGELFLG